MCNNITLVTDQPKQMALMAQRSYFKDGVDAIIKQSKGGWEVKTHDYCILYTGKP